jgi:sugar lactone lactonase YvrE
VSQSDTEVELLQDARAYVGEGPVWDPLGDRLAWLDIIGNKVHWYRPADGTTSELDLPKRTSALGARASGGLVMAVEDGFWVLEPDERTLRKVVPLPGGDPDQATPAGLVEFPPLWMNDGKVGPDHAFWAGSVVRDGHSGGGTLYRLDPDYRLTPTVSDIKVSSSIGWSPDGSTLYYADSSGLWLDAFAFDPDTSALGERRRLITWEPGSAVPDGLALDEEGHLWIAMFNGWAVQCYAPDGRLDREIRLPVARVASCAFGGPDLRDLYITTIRAGLSDRELADQPLAGGLFRVRPGVRGLPVDLFRG